MTKKLLVLGVVAMASCPMATMAQQLPNVGFEDEWVESRPWNSVCDTLSMHTAYATVSKECFGYHPVGWTTSDVLGIVALKEDNSGYGALGATEVTSRINGNGSASALKLTCNSNPFMSSQIVPAYVTLGKTWATNTVDFMTFSPVQKDGGCFGGLEFAARPDALSFDYQRAYAVSGDAPVESNATVLVYSWKGSWSQKDVPGNNAMSAEQIFKVTMVDRDRNILGMETSQGGEVSKTDDAELIAKTIYYLEGETPEWKNCIVPIEYVSDAIPEKINVVLAANDYFDEENIYSGASLSLDNVEFVYYSRLESLNFGGVPVADFDPEVYEYTCDGSLGSLSYELMGEGKGGRVSTSMSGNVLKVAVRNPYGADIDGKDEHVYSITLTNAETYNGYINIRMMGGSVGEPDSPASVIIASTGENACEFTLPDFKLSLEGGDSEPVNLGNICVPDVKVAKADGVSTYEGSVNGMELLDGQIVADVTLSGTIGDNGAIDMKIAVLWNQIPIDVTFTSYEMASIADIEAGLNGDEAEYYNLQGVKVDRHNLIPGVYVRRVGTSAEKLIIR